MDVVIAIFGDTGAELSGLRSSVDSLLKFGEGLERIVVVGQVPGWVGEEESRDEKVGGQRNLASCAALDGGRGATRPTDEQQNAENTIVNLNLQPQPALVPFRIPPMKFGVAKHDLVVDGILKAIRGGVVGGEFLYCPLGVTLDGQTDLAHYPRYCRRGRIRSIAEMVMAGKGGAVITKYWLSVTDTRQLLERNGMSAIDFSGKFLSHMDADDLLDVESLWVQEPHGAFGYEPACLFGNIRESKVASETPRWVEFR